MIDNDRLGTRIKARRQELGLTLKALESRAGVSATHVSEIERGRTSPTVKALARLSTALEKDISYFLSHDDLADATVVRDGEARVLALPWQGMSVRSLAGGVPGSKLGVYELGVDPGAPASDEIASPASVVYWLRAGRMRFLVDGVEYLLDDGDSLHIGRDCAHRFANVGEARAELVVVSGTRRHLPIPS